jgi:hypothetical protein
VGYDVVAEDRRRDRRVLLVVLVVVVVLVGAVYAAGWLLTSDRLPRGSRVGDVRVGGLTAREARVEVARDTAEEAARPVEVVVDDRTFRVLPADAGLEVDVAASVGQVPVGRSLDPRDMWEALVGGTEVPLLVVAVGDGLEQRVARIADEVDVPVVEGSVGFEGGRARATYPQVGHVLDREAAARAVQAAYPSTGRAVELTLQDVPPTVSTAEVSRALREVANPAVSGNLTYRFGRGLTVQLSPDDLASVLRVEAVDGRLRLRADADRLWSFFAVVDSAFTAREGDPRSYRVEDRVLRRSQVAPFLREEVVDGFTAAVRRPPGRRVVALPVTPRPRS